MLLLNYIKPMRLKNEIFTRKIAAITFLMFFVHLFILELLVSRLDAYILNIMEIQTMV
ncbi:hypothetical protein GCM10022423_46950 [Flavobacterium ginsengiterrae]|uniref:Uncharacterized protein n=1 Tax=Flavobacterium ginsengiterrae TaxID=871695 RepID=A0ABP7H5N3_9FLAO